MISYGSEKFFLRVRLCVLNLELSIIICLINVALICDIIEKEGTYPHEMSSKNNIGNLKIINVITICLSLNDLKDIASHVNKFVSSATIEIFLFLSLSLCRCKSIVAN